MSLPTSPPRTRPSLLPAGLALLCALCTAPARADERTPPLPVYRLDPSHTFVHWEVLHMGTSTSRGRFERIEGSTAFDGPGRRIDIGLRIDTRSVSTGSAPFDAVLKGAQLLAVEEHPEAWFVARQADFDGEQPRRIRGELTLRGRSEPLTLEAVRWKCGLNLLFRREVCGGDFEARLSRSAFGMTLAAGLVSDEVLLRIQVEAVRDPQADGAPEGAAKR